MSEHSELADEIMRFLDKHANSAAAYDPEFDEPGDRYSSPDACELHVAAERLRRGIAIDRAPWSDWGSGGYSPYTDKEAKAWHDELVEKVGACIGRIPGAGR